jgi:hypothetical protein
VRAIVPSAAVHALRPEAVGLVVEV